MGEHDALAEADLAILGRGRPANSAAGRIKMLERQM
jgi:hypothetical protein